MKIEFKNKDNNWGWPNHITHLECDVCDGFGWYEGGKGNCHKCNGKGKLTLAEFYKDWYAEFYKDWYKVEEYFELNFPNRKYD